MKTRQRLLWDEKHPIKDPPAAYIEPSISNNPNHDNLRVATAQWIEAHPRIFAEIEARALETAGNGKRFGIQRVVEEVRWDWRQRDGETEEFYINNNHTAYLARALVERHPWLAELLSFRQTRY
jgi:hypothetical protein